MKAAILQALIEAEVKKSGFEYYDIVDTRWSVLSANNGISIPQDTVNSLEFGENVAIIYKVSGTFNYSLPTIYNAKMNLNFSGQTKTYTTANTTFESEFPFLWGANMKLSSSDEIFVVRDFLGVEIYNATPFFTIDYVLIKKR